MDIQLNFINQSNDANNSQVVIFQKNLATNFDELAVAWLVIKNCAQGDNHPFIFPMTMAVSASDSYGNFTPHLSAQEGQLFSMVLTQSGDKLTWAGAATSPSELQVLNALPSGTINAMIHKAGKVFATKASIAPGQKAAFQFRPTIWIGVVSEIDEGQLIHSAILSSVDTELSLLGIASADIVMTGGGAGPNSKPFQFHLDNVVMA